MDRSPAAPMGAYPHLLEPWTLAGFDLRNRVVGSATSSVYSAGGKVTERLIDLYANRARGGVGLMVSEALISHRAQMVATRVRACDEANLDGLKRWAASVAPYDTHLIGQLYDPGRGRHHPGRSEAAISASARPDDLSWSVPRALTLAEISALVAELAETAHRLQRAGFVGVELSCGHGHLFHQFLSPQSNRRDDAYGGDTTGRTRLVREICAAVRGACGDNFILGIKLVGEDGVPGGVDEAEAARIIPVLCEARHVSYLAFVRGAHHQSLEAHVPDRSYPPTANRDMSRRLRAFAGDTPVLAIGRIATPAEAEALLAAGECEAVMLARALLADPAWVAKTEAGHEDEVRLCIGDNSCWRAITEGQPVSCDVNPRLGTPDEVSWTPPPVARRRHIVIVGAGVAGLETAWMAARRGHRVTVIGASARPGGALRINAAIPGCGDLDRVYRYQLHQARKSDVTFRLGIPADIPTIVALSPDQVVLATGAHMLIPDALRANSGALDLRAAVRDILASPGRRSGAAVLYDQDHSAGTYDAIELFAATFESAILLTPREAIGTELALVTRQRVQARIYGKRIPVATFAALVGIEGDTLHYRHVHTGDVAAIKGVRMLAYSTPRIPDTALQAGLRALGLHVERVGDCRVPRTLGAAIRDGQATGLAL